MYFVDYFLSFYINHILTIKEKKEDYQKTAQNALETA